MLGVAKVTPSHTSVSGPPPTCFGRFPDFQHPQWFVYHMCKITHEYLMTKISVWRKSNWLVLVAVMLIYCPPTWCLEKSRTRNRSTTWSGHKCGDFDCLASFCEQKKLQVCHCTDHPIFALYSVSLNLGLWSYVKLNFIMICTLSQTREHDRSPCTIYHLPLTRHGLCVEV